MSIIRKNDNSLLLTSGNPAKRIVLFALPMLGIEIIHLLYTMIDAFVVGRWLGINGLAAVGVGSSLTSFIFGFCFGISNGFTVITAQRVGSRNEEGIRRSVAAGIILSFFLCVIMLILLTVIRPLLSLMQTPAEILVDASVYVMITFCGAVPLLYSSLLSGIIRSSGDSFSPLVFFINGTVFKILFEILFVMFFSWGVRGAALATLFAELIAAMISLCFLVKRLSSFIPRKGEWRITKKEAGEHLSLGIAMALQRTIVEAGNILVQASINGLGALTIAAVSAAQRVRGLNMMPVFTVAGALTTYTAQNYGAGKMDRVNKGIFQTCFISLGLGVFMAALNHFTGARIVSLFLKDNTEAIALAARYILITGYTVFLLGLMLVFRSALGGLGQKTPLILCGIMETVMSIFAAFVLIPRLGFVGVCLVNPLSWLVSGIPVYIAFAILQRKFRIKGVGV